MRQTILFLCTGNYYRSRYAEILFNHLAAKAGVDWRADSRGLATEKGIFNVGPISAHTLKRLAAAGIVCDTQSRPPIQCTLADLAAATRVIALKESEHREMMEDRFPAWPDRIEYWHIHDLDLATADRALAEIENLVTKMIADLFAVARDRSAGGHARRLHDKSRPE
jgi:protein-tyrosine phosphatase